MREARICRPVSGNAAAARLWELGAFDVTRLQADLTTAVSGWDWNKGCFGHSLPLTTKRLSEFGVTHYNNLVKEADGHTAVPAVELLERCPYFQSIFDSFKCEKSSFRILRRSANSSYTLHADRDIGVATYRVQIPLKSNPEARLLVSTIRRREQMQLPESDFSRVEDWHSGGIAPGEMKRWLENLICLNQSAFCAYATDTGKLYYFHTGNYHNLFNFGSEDRFTLAIDLEGNDWLYDQFPQVLEPA